MMRMKGVWRACVAEIFKLVRLVSNQTPRSEMLGEREVGKL